MSELPTREDFLNHLNTKFQVFFDGERPTEVELCEVTEMREKPRYQAFALAFRAPHDVAPLQRLYRIEHDALGEMELFLVPFQQDANGLYFEALFNHQR